MGLVDYDSDSDADRSENDASSGPPDKCNSSLFAALPAPKGRVKKKILVEQPRIDHETSVMADSVPKRATGSGLSGLAALLPPPKRSTTKIDTQPSSEYDGEAPRIENASNGNGSSLMQKSSDEVRISGSNTQFKPKHIKAKSTSTSTRTAKSARTPLFSFAASETRPLPDDTEESAYVPILATEARPRPTTPEPVIESTIQEDPIHPSDLYRYDPETDYSEQFDISPVVETNRHNGHESRKRRRRGDDVPSDMTEYDAAAQYEANAQAIAAGDVGDAAPVRFVGGGKHQLSSLLNQAHAQRDALENSFMQQKRAMRDSKSKYGR